MKYSFACASVLILVGCTNSASNTKTGNPGEQSGNWNSLAIASQISLPDSAYREVLLGSDGSKPDDTTPVWSVSPATREREKSIEQHTKDLLLPASRQDFDAPYESANFKKHIVQYFTFEKDVYTLRTRTQNPIDQNYQFYKNDTQIFESKMCYATDPPIQDAVIIDGEIALTFLQGDCSSPDRKGGDHWQAIYYKGTTINEKEHVQGASHLFSYKGKLGFIAAIDGQDYVYFNGKKASQPFDIIRTHSCCMIPQPYIRLYQDGTFLFIGDRSSERYLTQINLNAYL